jgi:hypothetical protein
MTSTAKRKATATTPALPLLVLNIGVRSYGVDLRCWSMPDDAHLIILTDVHTGQVTTIKDLDGFRLTKFAASCTCKPHLETVNCRHVRAAREAGLLPNWTYDIESGE